MKHVEVRAVEPLEPGTPMEALGESIGRLVRAENGEVEVQPETPAQVAAAVRAASAGATARPVSPGTR